MRVGIVGGGIAGLGAAYTLKQHNISSIVFERNEFCGGRCSTRTIDGYKFDQGATSIAPRGKTLEEVMLQELDTSELVTISRPIFVHESLRISPGDPSKNRTVRYTYLEGNATLPKLLSIGIDVRYGQSVVALEKRVEGGYRILDETFDAIILTAPSPMCQMLLSSIGEFRSISNIYYRQCISVMLGYRIPPPATKYHALLDVEQRHPLTWMCIESAKCEGRAPEGCTAIIAQMSPQFSSMHFDSREQTIVDETTVHIQRLLGDAWNSPEVTDIKRWRWSQPEMTAMFSSVNSKNSTLLIAGDGLMGGRVENAFESGYRAAMLLVEQERLMDVSP
jgi:predicted NAD/FAD-dependent oxidoreductase